MIQITKLFGIDSSSVLIWLHDAYEISSEVVGYHGRQVRQTSKPHSTRCLSQAADPPPVGADWYFSFCLK